MLPIWAFFAAFFFRVGFLFFRGVAFDVGFGFALLIPGIFDISCWARTGTPATNRQPASRIADTLTQPVQLNVRMLFIIRLEKVFRTKEGVNGKDLFGRKQKDLVVSESERTRFSLKN